MDLLPLVQGPPMRGRNLRWRQVNRLLEEEEGVNFETERYWAVMLQARSVNLG